MAVRKKVVEDSFSIRDFNKGFAPRILKVGDRVDIYKIPYRQAWKIGSGVITKIIAHGDLMTFCEILRDGANQPISDFIYVGKVYNPYGGR